MIKLGLIGHPLKHSLSPAMHKAALADKGLKGDYVLLGTPPEKLATMVEFMKKTGFKGFNVTIPHKVEVMNYLDSVDKLAVKIGAVNTVVVEENKRMIGYNTDVFGFMEAIPSSARLNFKSQKAAVIGAGGAARAVTAGMAEMGISEVYFVVQEADVDAAFEAGQILSKNYPLVKTHCSILKENTNLSDISFIVNATPVGMEGLLEGISPLSDYSISSLPDDAFVYDIIYKPRKTELLELADKRGLETLDGLDMLVLQGAKAFYLWTGEEAPVDVMKAAISKPC